MHPGPAGSTASREPALPNVDCNICFSSGELREQVGAEVLAKDERNIMGNFTPLVHLHPCYVVSIN